MRVRLVLVAVAVAAALAAAALAGVGAKANRVADPPSAPVISPLGLSDGHSAQPDDG